MNLPRHVAIIMDGNGRWATKRFLPRVAGHQQGLESVRTIVTLCAKKKIPYLTLYAFSSENWQRPQKEVNFLLNLFLNTIKTELKNLHENDIKIKIIGDRGRFSEELQLAMEEAEAITQSNSALQVNVALNYGGRWDILQAAKKLCLDVKENKLEIDTITEEHLKSQLSLSDCPEPDLLIRTSGEFRISNFLLWHFAYTELYFSDIAWPDFDEEQFDEALKAFAQRQRRYGSVKEEGNDA